MASETSRPHLEDGMPQITGSFRRFRHKVQKQNDRHGKQGPQMEALVAPISKNTAAPQIALGGVKMRCSRKTFIIAYWTTR